MHGCFKQWMLLAAFVPTFAMAQSLQNQAPAQAAPAAPAAAAPVDPAKQAAIKDLLDAIDAQKLVGAIGNSAQMQSKQLVPAILSDALSENKTLNDKQKQAAVPTLQRNAVPKLVDSAGQVFATDAFRKDAMQAQYDAYVKYYTMDEIKDLATFYKSPTGRKFIQVQDQVGRDVVNGLMQKYMPQSIQATRKMADSEVASVKPSAK
ncbi:putative signal peptide protein [Candidatus Burkholderia pumila]|uniref:Signal peptide protein n=1 Tax=Candidatus Burkholderia pumila TaxID=1090375 RepID=A0ABR5HMD1_9BURK|nr:putative signal peptide protein [Candidatus Burkholderia pumila]